MQRQLSRRGMCKIVTLLDDHFPWKKEHTFLQYLDNVVKKTLCEMGSWSVTDLADHNFVHRSPKSHILINSNP